MSFSGRLSGSFTSTATPDLHDVVLPYGEPDLFILQNRTDWNATTETALISKRYRGMAEEAALTIDKGVNTNSELSTAAAAVTTNGFRFFDSWNPPTFAALALSGTEISNANPAVATMANTGSIQVGSVVRFDNTTSMLQASGIDFSVTAVTLNTNITLNWDAQNEAAAATAGNARLIIPGRFYPRKRYIVPVGGLRGITQATQCVVCTSVYHDFSVGERVRLKVPTNYGMTEANNLTGTVLSIGNASGAAYSTTIAANYNALRLNIDTSGFTTFAMPTSAQWATQKIPAEIIPAGANPEDGANPPGVPVNAAADNRNRYVMRCGTNVITSASAVYDWEAYYSNLHTAE